MFPVNEAVIARSAMAMKFRDEDPAADAIIAQTPRAALNPATGEAVDKKVIYEILSRLCHDGDPTKPWVHRVRFAKNALSTIDMTKRWNWAFFLANLHHLATWYFNRLIFTDICNSILPLTEKKAQEQRLARKAKKGWRFEGSQLKNRNLRGPQSLPPKPAGGRCVCIGCKFSAKVDCILNISVRTSRATILDRCRSLCRNCGLPSM